jgi:hypothetical protein
MRCPNDHGRDLWAAHMKPSGGLRCWLAAYSHCRCACDTRSRSLVLVGDHRHVPITPRQTTEQNERTAAQLTGQLIESVRYFLLWVSDDQAPWQWDFGVWHQPTMGVELVTERGDTFSLIWSQCDEWGFGVDLFDVPMAVHLIDEAAESWVDVSDHLAWAKVVGHSVAVDFLWNDCGTGRPPCAEAVKLATDAGALWIITADYERQGIKLSFQLVSCAVKSWVKS